MRIAQTVQFAGVFMRGPTSLPSVKSVVTGENINGVVQLGYDTVSNLIGYTPVNKAGDTMTGSLSLGSNALTAGAATFSGGVNLPAGSTLTVWERVTSNNGFCSPAISPGFWADTNGVALKSAAYVAWSSTDAGNTGGIDVKIVRNSAGQFDVRADNGLRLRTLNDGNWSTLNAGHANFNGHVLPTTTATYDLGSSGNKWNNLWLNNVARAANGTATAPTWTFVNANDTGPWLVSTTVGSRAYAISTDGAEAVRFGGSGVSRAATFAGNIEVPSGKYLGFSGGSQIYTNVDAIYIKKSNGSTDADFFAGASTFIGVVDSRGYQWRNSGGTIGGLMNSPSWDTSYVSLQNRNITESASNSAINQSSAGATIVNAAAGQFLSLKIGNQTKLAIDPTTSEAAFVGNITPQKGITIRSGSADPTISDLDAGTSSVWKNTTNGEIRTWVNDGGIMRKSAALT